MDVNTHIHPSNQTNKNNKILEVYLELYKISTMELFLRKQLTTKSRYFRKNGLSLMTDSVPKTPMLFMSFNEIQHNLRETSILMLPCLALI